MFIGGKKVFPSTMTTPTLSAMTLTSQASTRVGDLSKQEYI